MKDKDDDKTRGQLIQELAELRLQNAALKESASTEKYRSLVENVRDVIYELDSQGVVLYISPAVRDLLGYDSAEIVGKNFIELAHKDDRSSLTEWYSELCKGIEKPYEYRISNKSGELRWAHTKTRPVMEDGLFKGACGILLDVTSQRRAEEEIKNIVRFQQVLMDAVPSPIFYKDADCVYIGGNKAFERYLGMLPEQFIGKTVMDISPTDLAEKYDKADRELLNHPGVQTYETSVVYADGTRHDVVFNKATFTDAEGNVAGLIGVILDITERKQAEEQLQQTLESLRKAVGTTIQVMVSAVEVRDPYTAGHQIRSADLARAIATEMGLPQDRIDGLRMAGSIHDIGKLAIPAEILSKPTRLTELEFSLIKEHARQGYEMLKDVESSWPLAQIVYQHHERMDGSGYPRHLKGDDILVEARIMAVADVVESMSSHRPYRPSLGNDAALEEISKNSGNLYDPDVVDACLRLFHEQGYKFG